MSPIMYEAYDTRPLLATCDIIFKQSNIKASTQIKPIVYHPIHDLNILLLVMFTPTIVQQNFLHHSINLFPDKNQITEQ